MAAGKLMKHDFAPAWLKLPNQENKKSAKRSEHTSERPHVERNSYYYGDRHVTADDVYLTPQLRRPKSYSGRSGFSSDLRASSNTGQRTRSRPNRSNRGHMNGVNGDVSAAEHSTSRNGPSAVVKDLSRRLDREFSKLQHEHSTELTNGFASSSVEEEFPSLNGDVQTQKCRPMYSKVASVWDGSSREIAGAGRGSNAASELTSKTLVLKGGLAKRTAGKEDRLVGLTLEASPVSASPRSMAALKSPAPRNGQIKEAQSPVVIAAKVLNSCLTKQPKDAIDRKSHFFKLIRRESHESSSDVSQTEPSGPVSPSDHVSDKLSDPVSSSAASSITEDCTSLTVTDSSCVKADDAVPVVERSTPIEEMLLGSHEAEHRLLREMGWTEADNDDEDYAITEAEMQEFEAMCRDFKQKQLNHAAPQRNGIMKVHQLTKSSPLASYMSPFSEYIANVMAETAGVASNSSDDSDLSDS